MTLRLLTVFSIASLAAACTAGPPGPPPPGAPPGAAAQIDFYDAYYDGQLGAVSDGYWGDDGAFWYLDGDHQWQHDNRGHFRHGPSPNYSHFHGTGLKRVH